MQAASSAIASFALSVLLVHLVIGLARSNSWFDTHDARKIHNGEVPRIGGIGFAAAYILTAAFLSFADVLRIFGSRIFALLIAMPLVLFFGVFDDFKPLRPRYKLLVQSIAAIIVVSVGFTFHRLTFQPIGVSIEFGMLKYAISFVWIVGVTNALNLIDGVDGLAGGVSAIIALTFAAIFSVRGNSGAALLCLVLASSIGGFLVFNAPLPKAKIFMGDGGSQFLGFMLAVLPLLDNGHGGASLPLPFAAALLIIPIFDTFAAIWRRTRDGRRIDSPDKAHMHHKLMNLGLGARGVDAVVYSLQIAVGVLVFLSVDTRTKGLMPLVFLGAAYAIALAFFVGLHYLNRAAMAKPETAISTRRPGAL